MRFAQYLGILLGAVYGLAYRLLCDLEAFRGIRELRLQPRQNKWAYSHAISDQNAMHVIIVMTILPYM